MAHDVSLRAHVPHAPDKDDIAGTVESIAEITPEYLYRCYNTFYNLNNMALCVCGNCTEEEVLALCDKMLKRANPLKWNAFLKRSPIPSCSRSSKKSCLWRARCSSSA